MNEPLDATSVEFKKDRVGDSLRRCYACLFALPPEAIELPRDLEGRRGDHHVGSIDILTSVARGCTMCHHVHELARRQGFAVDEYEFDGYEFFWYCEGTILIFSGAGQGDSFSAEVYVREDDWLGQQRYADLTAFNPLIGLRRPVSGYTGSEVALARLGEWFATCTLKHSECRSGLTGELPHRVLCIDNITGPRVRLIEDCAEDAPFACLSHRWGSFTRAASLTRANLDQYRKQIPISAWYPLLKDALAVIYRLGIRYIWVDCLCIIQEDESDWRREATAMADIYAKAAVTLFADCCNGDDTSLFRRRIETGAFHRGSDSGAFTPVYDDECVLGNSNGVPVYISSESSGIEHPTFLDQPHLPKFETLVKSPKLPLLQRGWVFQEWLLSRRIIHSVLDEIVWECSEAVWCECRYEQNRWREMRARNPRDLLEQPWEDLIASFTTRLLTRDEDKLPTVAGISKRYAASRGLIYIAV